MGRVWEGFGTGFGRGREGFGKGFGRGLGEIWKDFGKVWVVSWALLGLIEMFASFWDFFFSFCFYVFS